MKTEKLTSAQFRARYGRKASQAKAPTSARAGKAKPGSPGRNLVEVRIEHGPCYVTHWIPEGSQWVEFWQEFEATVQKIDNDNNGI